MATTASATGLYVYGVTLTGVPSPVGAVDVGPLRALVREEPLAPYEPEALEAALRDEPGWLERRLRAHEAVLEAVHGAGPVAPFRFGTIFRSEPELRAALTRAEDELGARLEELRGASEWGVKAWVDDAALVRWLEERDEAAGRSRAELDEASTPGRRYLLEKKRARAVGAAASDLALGRAEAASAALAAEACEAVVDGPSGLDERSERRPVLRAAYLVDDAQFEAFARKLDEFRARDGEVGIEYALSGPWPPYSFVDVELA